MKTIRVPGYSPGSQETTIVLARIVSWRHIDYNGNGGTEIELEGGRNVTTRLYGFELEKLIKAAESAA